jgi:hypothetical protein
MGQHGPLEGPFRQTASAPLSHRSLHQQSRIRGKEKPKRRHPIPPEVPRCASSMSFSLASVVPPPRPLSPPNDTPTTTTTPRTKNPRLLIQGPASARVCVPPPIKLDAPWLLIYSYCYMLVRVHSSRARIVRIHAYLYHLWSRPLYT